MASAPDVPSVRYRSGRADLALTDQKLLSLVRSEMDMAIMWAGGAEAEERRTLMNAYLGRERGDERPGRSRVTSRAIYESVEWAKPIIMSAFFGGPDLVQFRPRKEEDEKQSEERTEAANYVFFSQNRGYEAARDAIDDALIRRKGWVKVWHEETIERRREQYFGKTEEEITDLLARDEDGGGWRIVSANEADPVTVEIETPEGMMQQEVPAWDCEIVQDAIRQRVRVEAVPPHEVYINPDARGPYGDTCRFMQHRQTKFTESRAIAMGFDPELVRRIPTSQGGTWDSEENDIAQALSGSGGFWQRNERSDAERQITVSECYIKVDRDGDGITEWMRVWVGGDYGELLLDYEPATRHPFALFTVIPLPHTTQALSLADTVADLNDIETTVRRMFLDNLYFSVQGRWDVRVTGQPGEAAVPMVDLAQLADAVPGSWVFTWAENALKPITTPVDIAPLLETFNLLVEDRHRRTGISPEAMGIDPETLAKTVFGQMAQQTASQLRALLMALNLSEGMRQVFELIDENLLRHPHQRLHAKLSGKWVEIDPSSWRGQLDVDVSVGIGSGSRAERALNLQNLLAMLKEARMGGLSWVTDKNLFNAIRDFVGNIGFKSPERYVTDPETMPQEPQPEDPKAVDMALTHHVRLQEIALKFEQLQVDRWKAIATHQENMAKIQITASTPKAAGGPSSEGAGEASGGDAPGMPSSLYPLPPPPEVRMPAAIAGATKIPGPLAEPEPQQIEVVG